MIADIKNRILAAAVELAEQPNGLLKVTRDTVARRVDISSGAVSYHWKDMENLRKAVIRFAIEKENVNILAQALAAAHPLVANLAPDVRRRVARTFTRQQ